MIKDGVYRHFKTGNEYRVIGIGKHSETLDDMVIYQPLYETDVAYWVRPAKMFSDIIEKDGVRITRFEYVRD